MFIRVKRSVHDNGTYEYLQVVESFRDGGRPRQRVLTTLGRRDVLVANGKLDALLRSLAKFSEKLRVVEAVRSQGMQARRTRIWGPPLVFGRLWDEEGLPEVLRHLVKDRAFQFDVERACFSMALQRLCEPGSDLAGSKWLEHVEAPGVGDLQLQHFYRACSFLADVREDLERELFFKDRDLFSQELDLVFLDTTSTYVYRSQETEMCKRGYSRDRRPDQPQYVLCVAVDKNAWPVAWEIYPGNTADKQAFEKIIGTLRERFKIRRIIVVADRGMISKNTITLLTKHDDAPFKYILGCRMRKDLEVRDEVLARAGRFEEVADNLEVKEVRVGRRRYIVCRNPEEAEKDAVARASMVEQLEKKLSHGAKQLIANKGYRRFLKMARGSVTIDRDAIEYDARMDGKFVLRTNTNLSAKEVAETYKGLWRVERTFRKEKSTFEVRPIYHHRDDTTIGHIVASFLALRLEMDLQLRLEKKNAKTPWAELMRDLGQVQAVDVELDGKRYLLRTDLIGAATAAFDAAGVRPPEPVTFLGPVKA